MRPTQSVVANEVTSPDELIKVLKRYLRESDQSERAVASRIGVNHHTLHRWLAPPVRCVRLSAAFNSRCHEPTTTLGKGPRGEQYYQRDQSDQNNFQAGSPHSPGSRRRVDLVFATQWSPADRVNKMNVFHIPLLSDWKTQTQQIFPWST
jgi:hypothetical protein